MPICEDNRPCFTCMGYGFPAERGGPMSYADSLGLDVVLKADPVSLEPTG